MKKLSLLKALIVGVAIAGVIVFLSPASETATPQVEQSPGRYQIYSGEFNYVAGPGLPPGRGQGMFKLDTQSGQSWILDAKNNRWLAINN